MIYRNKNVPELIVSHLEKSLAFWVGILGFTILYERTEERFVYLDLNGVQFMLEEHQEDQWVTAPLVPPFGRGVNFQIDVEHQDMILSALEKNHYPLFSAPQERVYQVNNTERVQRQFLVQDPDGYLLRLVQVINH